MSVVKLKSTNTRSRSLKRLMRQKKERSEVRKNTSYDDPPPQLPAFEQCPTTPVCHKEAIDAENLSPVMEEAVISHSPTAVTAQSVINIQSTIKHKESQPMPRLGSRYNPAIIFPYSNKPHEARQRTIAEESKQWESLFDPQHTFGSFQTGIAKPVSSQHYFYTGKWPLDQQDIIGMIPKPKRPPIKQRSVNGTAVPNISDAENDSVRTAAKFAFPTVPSPTLPDRQQLELHINPVLQDNENEHEQDVFDPLFPKSGSQIEILPCPSLTQFPKYKQSENETLWKDRLELLNTIQQQGFREELNGTRSSGYKGSTASRLQRQLKRKAEKIKRETLVDSSTEEDDDENECVYSEVNASEDGTLVVAMGPDTAATQALEEQDTASSLHTNQHESSLVSLDDEWENISFRAPYFPSKQDADKQNIDKQQQEEAIETKKKNRPTFLLFAFGFLFPPLWIIGALYSPSSSLERTTCSKRIDQKWKKCSRNAFFMFFIIAAAITVLISVLQPEAVGFRNNSNQVYQGERVVFDETDTIIDNTPTATDTAKQQLL